MIEEERIKDAMKTRIIMVGGFLGAGKTTLLWECARKITESGKHVGLICTDLSATILQPLKEKFQDTLVVAPLTVLADPSRLSAILDGGTSGLHRSAAYIFRKQLEEADIILINKTDMLTHDALEVLMQRTSKEWPLAQVAAISAKTGEGLQKWLDDVMKRLDSGTHLAEVDYDVYSEGEAVLGWLNASFQLKGNLVDWDELLSTLLHSLSRRFDQIDVAVGHVKLLIEDDNRYSIGNLTGKSDTIRMRGSIGSGNQAKLIINARVQMAPAELEYIIREEQSNSCGDKIRCETIEFNCLSPGRPNPTYRYDKVTSREK